MQLKDAELFFHLETPQKLIKVLHFKLFLFAASFRLFREVTILLSYDQLKTMFFFCSVFQAEQQVSYTHNPFTIFWTKPKWGVWSVHSTVVGQCAWTAWSEADSFSKHLCAYLLALFFLRNTESRCQIKTFDPRKSVTPKTFDQCFSQWQCVVCDLGSIELMQLSKPHCEYRVLAAKGFPVKPVKRNNWCCSQVKYSPIIPWEISYYFFKKKTKQKKHKATQNWLLHVNRTTLPFL